MTVWSTSNPAGSVTVNVLDIVPGTSVDGPGLRTAIYLAGCSHACPGCQNPESWDPSGGRSMTVAEIVGIVAENEFPVTLTGGDPLFHPEATGRLVEALRGAGVSSVWLYTGYTFEQILDHQRLLDAVRGVDVIVDGPFRSELRDPSLSFRGSANQRIILLPESLAAGRPCLWQPPTVDF